MISQTFFDFICVEFFRNRESIDSEGEIIEKRDLPPAFAGTYDFWESFIFALFVGTVTGYYLIGAELLYTYIPDQWYVEDYLVDPDTLRWNAGKW